MLTYKNSGVDIDEGNKAVDLIKENVKSTYDENVLGDLGNFSGMYSLLPFMNMKEPVLLSSTDGVGTKLLISQQLDNLDNVGIDLVAMCVNDLICQGAKPLFFLDYIATGKLKSENVKRIVDSIVNGCKMSGCSLLGGETAEMPGMYKNDDFDLGGFSVGIADKENLITGKNVKSGDSLIGINSSGVHSNGFSFVRNIFKDYDYNTYIERLGMTLGECLLNPTKIYVNLVLELIKNFEIKAISHITGGGVIENITRVIPKGLGLDIETSSWDKPEIFKLIEEFDIDKKELHKSFNMGIGLVLVVDKEIEDEVVEFINKFEEELLVEEKYKSLHKSKAYKVGAVVDTHDGVNLC